MKNLRVPLSLLASGAALALLEPMAGALVLAAGGVTLAISLEEPLTDGEPVTGLMPVPVPVKRS